MEPPARAVQRQQLLQQSLRPSTYSVPLQRRRLEYWRTCVRTSRFNNSKTKLFFFASQEYTRQFVNATTQYRTMPTELERAGDFSQSYAGNGAQRRVNDP